MFLFVNVMFRNIPKLLTFIFFLVYSNVDAQEIWRESFSIPERGIWGDSNGQIQFDFSGISSWHLLYENISVSNSDDYAKTVTTSGGRFEIRDVEGEVTWYSEEINISEYENVRIQLFAQETGSGANEETKYLKAFFKLDEGSQILFETNGENYGNWGTDTVLQSSLNGEKLQIIIYMRNSYSADKVILDEVVITGEEKNFEPLSPGDLVINEVLFNPFPEGSDYVEIYNNSEKEISFNRLYLASRNNDLELIQLYPLSSSREKFFPHTYRVLTKDTNGVFPYFNIKCKSCFLQMDKSPSFNNDEDYVVLLDENLQVIDEFHYTDKMHSPLFADEEGVSLERISFSGATNDPKNWHSASTNSGYGTPGYENSQFDLENIHEPSVTFSSESFSPNFDGYNDDYRIHYELESPGYIGNIWIFDSTGRLVLKLAENEILGTSGEFVWNGNDETGHRQNLGVYVIVVEFFNTQGKVERFKDGVVLTDILE